MTRPLRNLSADGRIVIDLKVVECEDVDWTNLAQNRDRWRALGNTALKFREKQNERNLL
jgi:hypothetical protein